MADWGISKLTVRPTLAVVLRYGLAVLLVAIALAISVITHLHHSPPRFVSHFVLLAIAITFWCAGTGPGVLALLLSCLGVAVLARTHFLTPDFPLGSFLIFFVLFSLLLSLFTASRRRALQELRKARDELEIKVVERTAELRRSERELRDVVDTIPALVWSTLPDGSNTYVNKRFVEYTGSSPEQMAGSGWQALIHPDDLERHAGKWMEAVATGKPHESEVRSRRSDGQYRWQLDRGVPLRDEAGNIVKWYGVVTDIEDRKRAEEALRTSEAYLAEAQRLSHTGSFGWKPDTGETVWSDETYRIFEYEPSVKPTIDSVAQRVHPEDRADVKEVTNRALAGATDFEHAYRLLLPDGRVKHVHAIAHVLQDASGNREFVGAVTDITERKAAEEALRSSEAYLAEAQRLSHTGSWVWNAATGEPRYWSEECYRVLGYDPAEPLPSLETFFQRILPNERAAVREQFDRAIRDKADFELDLSFVHPITGIRNLRSTGHAVVDRFGDLREIVGTVMDITESKIAEKKIRRLVDANILGVFVGNMQGSIAEANDAFLRLLQYDRQDLVSGRVRWTDLTPAEWRERDERAATELKGTGTAQPYEKEFFRKDGGRVPVLIGGALFQEGGNEGVVFVLDLSEQKQAEGKIREQEVELRQILDFAPQLIAVYGPNWERLYINRIALDYLGLTLDEWRQQRIFGAEDHHPDDSPQLEASMRRALSSGSGFESEVRVRKADGSYRWFLSRFHPVHDEQGQIVRWYVGATDIEDRKRAEERLQQENVALREEIDKASMFEEIVGTSRALQTVLSRISKVAPSDSTVLITGETGTGKELVARAIHRRSNRSSRTFVSVNCAAIPRDLIASELFGHEKGAFTGATQQRLGRFELANGGTLFLDEVGELPAETQIALLRVLQEHEFERVGGTRQIRVDVRLIAATNRDLQAAISAGSFRSDLFYRLHVFPVEIPPLRERREDIPLLLEYFIDRYARKAGKNITSVNKKTLELLQSYPWPGNIRELQNVIERSVILSSGEVFSVDQLWLSKETSPPTSRVTASAPPMGEAEPRSEQEIIEAALAETRGRVWGPSGAAAKLRVPPSTLDHRIKALKINKIQFKFR